MNLKPVSNRMRVELPKSPIRLSSPKVSNIKATDKHNNYKTIYLASPIEMPPSDFDQKKNEDIYAKKILTYTKCENGIK